jgi:membrane protein required for colicin V production
VTAFDFAVVAVITLSGVFAYSRGFVREALSLASWVFAGVAAYYGYPYAAPIFARFLPAGTIAAVAAATTIFILALAVAHLVAKILAKHVKQSPLSSIDRAIGLIFGLARGLILVSLAYIALAWALPPGEQRPHWFAQSRTLPYLRAGGDLLEGWFAHHRPAAASRRAVETEADKAMRAFTKPAAPKPEAASAAPAYTPDEQRDLNRLIEQQSGR